MNFDLSDEQKLLADQVRGLLAARAPFSHLRRLINEGADWDEALWREFSHMGFLGANLPEAYGGLGLTELDLGVIFQELGRANAALPVFSSIALAADAIAMAGSDAQKSQWLPRLASGEIIACFASAEGAGPISGTMVSFEHGVLSGAKRPVADAGVATIAVVQAGDDFVIARLDQPAVRRVRLESFDQLRPHYLLEFDGAEADVLPVRGALPKLLDRAAVYASFEAVGAAEACLTMARDYALDRKIFSRPLASYQAIKHKLADIAVAIELARSNAYFAGWAAASSPDDLPAAAAAARLTSIRAFETAARENLQVHGGFGYTFESNCHFYYRRERLLAVNVGNRGYWADRLLKHQPGGQARTH